MKSKLALGLLATLIGISVTTLVFAQDAMMADTNTTTNTEMNQANSDAAMDAAPAENSEATMNSEANSAPATY